MARPVVVAVMLLGLSACAAESDLKAKFKEVTASNGGAWGYGHLHEHKGAICDDGGTGADLGPGCAVLFIADPDDEYNLGTVAEDQQNDFLNTFHYESAWNYHGHGFLGGTLPRAPKDIDPVCVVANVSGRMVLGYEEGNGGDLLPCPGHDHGVPFTEEMVLDGLAGKRSLEDMCDKCYWAVCTGQQSFHVNPRHCGGSGDGGVDLEDDAEFFEQVTPVYHCHLTMADEGACDWVQSKVLEDRRQYNMEYGVSCGWDKVKEYNISYCDCTRSANRWNGCRREEATQMAYAGVVCGNCWSVGFNKNRAYESIFKPKNSADPYDGSCAAVRTATTEAGKNYAKMMCSKGIWCPSGGTGGDNCKFHCDHFGKHSEMWYDEECGQYVPDGNVENRKLLSDGSEAVTLETKFDWGSVMHEVVATGYHQMRRDADDAE